MRNHSAKCVGSRNLQFVFLITAWAALYLPLPVMADKPAVSQWSVEVSTAPHVPQDVWFAGMGDNVDGWRGGGSICLNQLAQGIPRGEQLTFLLDPVEGGIVGVDGTPVPVGTYTFPGTEEPTIDYSVTPGQTFYIILDAYIVQSKLPGFNVGDSVQLMFMWDYAPGRTDRQMVLWIDFGFGLFPFLNEGTLMADTRMHP